MPQFTGFPALQARTFDIQDIQRKSLQNQLLGSKLQQAQNPQADPRLAFDMEKDQRTQGLQHTKVLGQYAGAAAQASGVQRVMIHGEAVKYAQANGIPTDGWLDPSDPNYVAWAQAQQAKAGEAERQAGAAPSGYRGAGDGLEAIPGGPADPAQAGRLAAAKRDPSEGTPKSLTPGNAYNALLEEKTYNDAGEKVPLDVANRASVARHVLKTKHYRSGPDGAVLSYTPGVPEGFEAAPSQSGQQPGETAPPSAGGLKTEIPGTPKVNIDLPVSTIRKISELLNDPGGETITGVIGTAKRLGGGLARQMGIPVSERSERLQRLLETLQGQMGPIILNEKRLSETERARLERIVGTVSPTMDDKSLRSALADLVDFIVSVEQR